MKQKEFIRRIEKHKAILKKNNAVFDFIGYIKLLFVVIFTVSLYFIFTKKFSSELIMLVLVELISLIALWIYHDRLSKKINYSNEIIAINQRHLDRISGKWINFSDSGTEFVNSDHPYASDLDIIGKKSFFQFLNTTHTWHGRQAFANDLLQPHFPEDELIKRQEAVAELCKDIDFSNYMEYCFSKIGVDNSAQKLVDELKDQRVFIKNKIFKFLLMYMPIALFISAVAIFIIEQTNLVMFVASIVVLQAIVWIIGMHKTQKYLGTLSNLPYKLSAYSEVIVVFKDKKFASNKLKQIQAQLESSELSAARAIKSLSKISDKLSVQQNGIVWFIVNALFLWDYKCAISFENWKMKYASVAEGWFLALGEFESLLSFSNLPNICNNTCLPSIVDSKTIKAQDLGHPLIPNDIRVNNTFTCQDSIFIISGSNMSGKTTYLRTVGINFVLARIGSFVCAKEMTFSPMEIVTSMRIADDLTEGVSTFYAELKRIKSIIEVSRANSNMIFLIDEIFRGTNSVDRLSGAKTILSKLNEVGAIGIITTHDLELCEITNQYSRIINYSFSEYYRDNKICFDYQIKQGKSTTTNAKYLMKMVGII